MGTFIINTLGSFVLGLVTGLAAHHTLPTATTTVIGIGFCGGFTTWSTYCWETIALAESGALGEAAVNVVGSLSAGFAAAGIGFVTALTVA